MDESSPIIGQQRDGVRPGISPYVLQGVLGLANLIGSADRAMYTASYKVLEDEFGFTPGDLAVIGMYENLVLAGCIVFWGAMADYVPKFAFMSCAALAWAFLSLCMGVVQTYAQLFAIRVLMGAAAGCMTPLAQVIVVRLLPSNDRAKAFGILLFLSTSGSLVGETVMITFQHVTGPFDLSGWRICWFTMTAICGTYSILAAAVARFDTDVPAAGDVWSKLSTRNFTDMLTLLRIPSVVLIAVQGLFRAASVHVLYFTAMWIQYQGFDDRNSAFINSSRFYGWMFGSLFAGWASDHVAKTFGDEGRIFFGQVGDVLRVLTAIAVFGVLPSLFTLGSQSTTPILAGALLTLGFAQPFAFVGLVRPVIAEVVPHSSVGSAYALVMLIDDSFSAIIGGPLIGIVADAFGYVHLGSDVQMTEDHRAANGVALGKCLLWVVTICHVSMLVALSFLHKTYLKDRTAAQSKKLLDKSVI